VIRALGKDPAADDDDAGVCERDVNEKMPYKNMIHRYNYVYKIWEIFDMQSVTSVGFGISAIRLMLQTKNMLKSTYTQNACDEKLQTLLQMHA
jgi:hypothetical protein